MLGLALLVVALLPGGPEVALLAAVPAAGLGALLLIASVDLAASRRLWDCRPSCYPVIAATALVTGVADPLWGSSHSPPRRHRALRSSACCGGHS